jgi:hypothetical protein
MSKHIGTLHPKKTLFFRRHIGEAEAGKLTYEMATNMSESIPIIQSKQTGKWFTLSWQEIIDLAILAGIDKPEQL